MLSAHFARGTESPTLTPPASLCRYKATFLCSAVEAASYLFFNLGDGHDELIARETDHS